MDFIWQSITDWLKEILVSGVISNLTNMFDSTNTQVGGIVGQVGLTPQAWNSGIFSMIQNFRSASGSGNVPFHPTKASPSRPV